MPVPDYISKEQVIMVLKSHMLPEDTKNINWDNIVDNGRICNKKINGIEGCYGYEYPPITMGDYISKGCVFIHPITGCEVDFDPSCGLDDLGV